MGGAEAGLGAAAIAALVAALGLAMKLRKANGGCKAQPMHEDLRRHVDNETETFREIAGHLVASRLELTAISANTRETTKAQERTALILERLERETGEWRKEARDFMYRDHGEGRAK
jgi:hypothetical protein